MLDRIHHSCLFCSHLISNHRHEFPEQTRSCGSHQFVSLSLVPSSLAALALEWSPSSSQSQLSVFGRRSLMVTGSFRRQQSPQTWQQWKKLQICNDLVVWTVFHTSLRMDALKVGRSCSPCSCDEAPPQLSGPKTLRIWHGSRPSQVFLWEIHKLQSEHRRSHEFRIIHRHSNSKTIFLRNFGIVGWLRSL